MVLTRLALAATLALAPIAATALTFSFTTTLSGGGGNGTAAESGTINWIADSNLVDPLTGDGVLSIDGREFTAAGGNAIFLTNPAVTDFEADLSGVEFALLLIGSLQDGSVFETPGLNIDGVYSSVVDNVGLNAIDPTEFALVEFTCADARCSAVGEVVGLLSGFGDPDTTSLTVFGLGSTLTITNSAFSSVPLPGGLPLAFVSLAVLGWAARRRHAVRT